MSLLSVKDVNYFYQDGDSRRFILKDVTCEFEKGKFYTILGESGSGKTTFLSLLAALDKPKSGQILFEAQDISSMGFEKYRRTKVGIIFQAYNLVPFMTATENVQVAMSITDNDLPGDTAAVAKNLLDYIGISPDKAGRTVNKLSGGEQQRVAIARALSTNVDLILADEPTGNLDEEMEQEIVEVFRKLAHEHNKCVIVVTHSSQIATSADVIYRLRKGNFEAVAKENLYKSPTAVADFPASDPAADMQFSKPTTEDVQ